MNVHKVTVIFIDYENVGADNLADDIENTRICQRWPEVFNIETENIGEWSDDHPLNNSETHDQFLESIFPSLKGLK